ncbi:hypothetical protein Dsin_012432 [Dipteronia sinensis]|uniref:CCHC-type domain-containing protein n=1 Tax=Dipteronia sinensis TaxID=43782 RepID=A0AAE0AI28_9ROSI|nr:hypothetical protein Dsin_012432 [Dipteronia sinensis]
MCMNRRTARWLAEQIGVLIEIPSESKESWGKFMRVKVQIDITKPLKRWLRLKLGKSDKIVVAGLKYERLPDFCYACGRLGHVIKECTYEEARKGATDGSATKYGQWLKAPGTERLRSRFQGQISGNSSEKDRSLDKEHEMSGDRLNNIRPGSMSSHNNESASAGVGVREVTTETRSGTLKVGGGFGPPQADKMSIDGPRYGPDSSTTVPDCRLGETGLGPVEEPVEPIGCESGLRGRLFFSLKTYWV